MNKYNKSIREYIRIEFVFNYIRIEISKLNILKFNDKLELASTNMTFYVVIYP